MMRNLRRVTVSIDEGLERARFMLHEEKATFMTNHLAQLKSCYEDYDNHGVHNTLHEVTPLWGDAETDTRQVREEKKYKRNLAEELYGSNRPVINKHWEELQSANGGQTLMCPICGIRECNEMDHYIPRSLMPEYSVHLTNLIPLCHRCNHKKGDKWLNGDGQRMIFNAYFDAMPEANPVRWYISISDIDGFPQMNTDYNPNVQMGAPAYSIVDCTIAELELMDVYKTEVSVSFRKELVRIEETLRRRPEKSEAWNELKSIYQSYLQQEDVWSVVDRWIFNAIVTSQDMDNWVEGL